MATPVEHISSVITDERGSPSMEYALIASIVSIVIVGALILIGGRLSDIFVAVGNAFSG